MCMLRLISLRQVARSQELTSFLRESLRGIGFSTLLETVVVRMTTLLSEARVCK